MSVRYIFSINAGRSGSDYLTALLAQARNTVSRHEGAPLMNGLPMVRFNEGQEAALDALMPLKVAEMQRTARWGKIYCETNRTYVKGWGYLLPDRYIPQEEIGVIILQRDASQTAHSLLRVREVPGASSWSRQWLLPPGAPRNLSQPATGADPYDLCRWYVDEIALRAAAYQTQFPRITYVSCTLEQLNDYAFVRSLFDTFGLIPKTGLGKVVGARLNTRPEWPKTPLVALRQLAPYPSADDLPDAEWDALLAEMVAYLHQQHAAELAALQPNPRFGDSLSFAVIHLVAHLEAELEQVFQRRLKFTEMEWVLIYELLYSLDPRDASFILIRRTPAPGVRYRYDFNVRPPHPGTVIRHLGWWKSMRLLFTGKVRTDYSHHNNTDT